MTVPRNRGIGGAHNSVEFFKNDVNIVDTTNTSIQCVRVVEYNMPKLNPNGTPAGGYGSRILTKTIYDPSIISDLTFVNRGIQAANNAFSANGGVMPSECIGLDSFGAT